MKLILSLIICSLTLSSVSYGQVIVDGLDTSSEYYTKDIRVSISTNKFGVSTVIVEIAKASVPKGSSASVVLRSSSKKNEDYIYLPILLEDGDDIDSWSTRTAQNVTRTWMRGRHGIFFSVFKMPNKKIKECSIEVLIGDHMNNPTFEYIIDKVKETEK